jgi:uncharacterized membrane protein
MQNQITIKQIVMKNYHQAIAIGLSIIGFGISIYLTIEHYAASPPICVVAGPIDCAPVLKSQYSVVPGTSIPVTIPGMIWFLVTAASSLFSLYHALKNIQEPPRTKTYQIVWGACGVVSILYFIFAEITMHKICMWCTIVHIFVVTILFLYINRPEIVPIKPPKAVRRSTMKKR